MPIPELIFWHAATFLLLIAGAFLFVLLRRALQHRPLFTEADWLFLFGFPKEKVMTASFWGRVALANFVAIAVGFNIGLFLPPLGIGWFIVAVVLMAAAVVSLLPKFLK